jgi:hypothetical protein
VDESALVDSVGFCAGIRAKGKHRTEDTEATEGGLGLVDESALVDSVGFRAGIRAKGKDRTEVTEGLDFWGEINL